MWDFSLPACNIRHYLVLSGVNCIRTNMNIHCVARVIPSAFGCVYAGTLLLQYFTDIPFHLHDLEWFHVLIVEEKSSYIQILNILEEKVPHFHILKNPKWTKDTHLSSQSLNRHFIEHRRAAASLAHSMTTGAWGDLTETLRPGTAAPLGPAGGGKIQGAAPVRRPSTTGSMGRYEAQKQLGRVG